MSADEVTEARLCDAPGCNGLALHERVIDGIIFHLCVQCAREIDEDDGADTTTQGEETMSTIETNARKYATTNAEITSAGRADHRHCSEMSNDAGLIADSVHETVGRLARELGVTGTWDDESLSWETDGRYRFLRGDRVSTIGLTDDDSDEGIVQEIVDADTVRVGWSSGVVTTCAIDRLEVVS